MAGFSGKPTDFIGKLSASNPTDFIEKLSAMMDNQTIVEDNYY